MLLAAAVLTSFAAGCNQGNTSASPDGGNTAGTGKSDSGSGNGETAAVFDSQFSTIFFLDGKTIYNNGQCLIDVSDPDKPVFLNVKQDPEESSSDIKMAEPLPECVYLTKNTSVNYGKEGLETHGDLGEIYHYDMTDPQAVIKETLYDSGSWKSEISKKLGNSISDEDAGEASDNIMKYSSDWTDGGDGYVYFCYTYDSNHIYDYASINYSVGRFAKDGKGGVEFMPDDIKANNIAVKDGYIYYSDTGYVWDGKKITADRNRVGVYRVKTDGTDKQQLVSVKTWGKDDPTKYDGSVSFLEIIGDDLYYIAQDGGEESYLYKLSLSGGAPVKVVNGSVSGYWVDTNSNTLFYYDGVAGVLKSNGSILYSMPLSGGEPKAMFRKLSANEYTDDFSVVGDYLYISDKYNRIGISYIEDANEYDDSSPAGMRYNLKTGEMEYLRSYCIVKRETDYSGFSIIKEIGPLNIEWVKYENRPVEDGITVYV